MAAAKGNQYAKGCTTNGQPTSFKPEYVEQAAKLCKLGATDSELADFFGVHRVTIHRWKIENKDFCNVIKVGKRQADERVERSLYERALGYSHHEDKIFLHEGEPVIVPTVKHYPPESTAMIFWLKNRKRKEWRDKVEHEHEGNMTFTLPEGSDKA